MQTGKNSIVFTLKAKCRDCYKCLRHCPVHAIGIKDSQAYVEADRCIQCGNCVKICPQNAKTYRNDLGLAKELVKSNKAYVTIAPSFAATYTGWETMRVPSALRKLGFIKAFETSEAAPLSAKMAKKIMDETNRGGAYTACPVVANYVEKYKPEKLSWLLDISSPMILHGRALKDAYGSDIKVIFIGPCIAKKGEAEREGNNDSIDAVLTFEELAQWMSQEGVTLKECEESSFDKIGTQSFSRFFPLPGAMSKSAGMDEKKGEFITASGSQNVMELFDFDFENQRIGAEPLFCAEGCINGPCIGTDCNLFERRMNLTKYAGEQKKAESFEVPDIKLSSEYAKDVIETAEVSEDAIYEVYKNTGKLDESQRLNCGACGYPSCRDMAVAVINGNAEEEMCIPFMRRMAQARGDMLMETTPNGVVIVDEKLRILSTNKAFKKDFLCGDAVIGKEISYLLPVNDFEEIAGGKSQLVNNIINCYGKVYHQILYPLPQENKYAGIYSDITQHKLSEKKLENIKKETARQAQLLLENQLDMARKMAEFLGKSTAKSEEIVEKLIGSDD